MNETAQEKLDVVKRLEKAYNEPNFDEMLTILADDIYFSHRNRGLEWQGNETVVANLRMMNDTFIRRAIETNRCFVDGDIVVREAHWAGTPAADSPGVKAGEENHLDFASIFTVRGGKICEWIDFA